MSFNTMFKVFDKGEPKHEDIEKIPSFMFCKWLSNNSQTIQNANLLNQYYNMPIKNQFFFINNIYKGKKVFIKFPKNQKDESFEISILSKHFKISQEKAKEYLNFISKDELQGIINIYKE